MIMNTTIRKNLDLALLTFLKKRKQTYPFNSVHPILFEGIKDFCARDGKRIRPLLMYLSYRGYTNKKKIPFKKLYTSCGCLELLHDFMLIHDDIIDRADLRRGQPTLHKILAQAFPVKDQTKLGNDLAIIAGDIVYALAIEAFLCVDEELPRKEQALRYFIQTAALTAMGEFIDIVHGFENIKNITEHDVFLNYSLKTARYTFECPLIIGAILAGAPPRDIQKLSQLGKMLGQAFQIQDDIIGIFSSQKKIGKSILSDLAEQKKTILICHAYKNLSKKDRDRFLKIFLKPHKNLKDLLCVQRILLDSGSLAYSLNKIETLLLSSRRIFERLNIMPPFKAELWTMFSSFFQQSQQVALEHNVSFKDHES